MRVEVEALLDADKQAGSIIDLDLAGFAGGLFEDPDDPERLPFEQCGEYQLVRMLGRGGMGVVYLARSKDRDRVAVKILRERLSDDPALRRRFDLEKNALGRLRHRYIATLYNTGAESGRPWFAMDYVEGKPLDRYCEEAGLGMEDRLRLLHKVCEAVQYAHRELVVHCDLTPGNILVQSDGDPRLVDFGIAKVLDDSGAAGDLTGTGQRPYTIEYAAPELLRRGQPGTYTDVYSLGVILYLLLVGRTPFDLSKLSPGEIENVVCDREPAAPSVYGRGTPLGSSISRSAWKDLDQLCLWALRKSPEERCTLEQFTGDLDGYLRGEPLQARPVSRLHRFGKFLRRRRRAALAVSFATALLIGVVAYYNHRVAAERDIARNEAARTDRVRQFMVNLFEGGDQQVGPAKDLKVITLLERGVKEADALNRDPAIQADLYETLGTVYQQLGDLPKADSLLMRSLGIRRSIFGADDPQVARSLLAIGRLRFDQAQYPDAERLDRQALAIFERRLSPDDKAIGNAMTTLGRVMDENGKYPKALEILSGAERIQSLPGADEHDLADAVAETARTHFNQGDYATSDKLVEQVLPVHRRLDGPRHPNVASDLTYLGYSQAETGHFKEAERYFREALEIDRDWYGNDNLRTASAALNLGQVLNHEERYREAEALLKPALTIMESATGSVHTDVSTLLDELGYAARELGRFDEAIAYETQSLDVARKVKGDNHQDVAIGVSNLASAYLKAKQYDRAAPLFRDAIERFAKLDLSNGVDAVAAHVGLGRTFARQKHYPEAEKEFLEGYEILKKQPTPSVYWLRIVREELIPVYQAMKMPEKVAQLNRLLKN